jgi:glutamate-1-semialdehyde 2,1-aminomutase
MHNGYLQSEQLRRRAEALLMNGVGTLSKSPRHICPGCCPSFVARAKGAYFWDVDGNRYIDYPLALGAVVLGYAYDEVDDAVKRQMQSGFLYSLSSPLELELAEILCQVIPAAEKVRFFKSGSEAMTAAVRVARAFTGREKVAVCGYHGWHDWTIARGARRTGIPVALRDLIFEFKYNDLASVEAILAENYGEIAALILEPVGMYAPENSFLEKLADLARKAGALLIFDEVITGFRMHLGGAQAYFGVTPDLAAFGKAMANGYPLSAFVGKKDIIDAVQDQIFVSSTFSGDLLAISAALKTIEILRQNQVNAYIMDLGQELKDGLNKIITDLGLPFTCEGMPHKTFLIFHDHGETPAKLIETVFRQECLRRGVFLGYGHFTSYSHTLDDMRQSLNVAAEVFHLIKQTLKSGSLAEILEGEVAEDVFKRY